MRKKETKVEEKITKVEGEKKIKKAEKNQDVKQAEDIKTFPTVDDKKVEQDIILQLESRPSYNLYIVKREGEKILTELRNTGKVIGEILADDGSSSITNDEVIIVLRKN